MARLVRLEANGPVRIETGGKPVWVCACGLSKTFPICDGTHKGPCREEAPGTLYIYDAARTAVVETRADTPPASA